MNKKLIAAYCGGLLWIFGLLLFPPTQDALFHTVVEAGSKPEVTIYFHPQ